MDIFIFLLHHNSSTTVASQIVSNVAVKLEPLIAPKEWVSEVIVTE